MTDLNLTACGDNCNLSSKQLQYAPAADRAAWYGVEDSASITIAAKAAKAVTRTKEAVPVVTPAPMALGEPEGNPHAARGPPDASLELLTVTEMVALPRTGTGRRRP